MASTRDYEHLLEKDNVIGVDFHDGTVRTFVSQKVPADALEAGHDVTEAVSDADVEVVDIGYGEKRDGIELLASDGQVWGQAQETDVDHKARFRPVVGGISEHNLNGPDQQNVAGTGGIYPVRVVDPSRAMWTNGIPTGTLVRLSCNHVYARFNQAAAGELITQPSGGDGGMPGTDGVGQLCGYVPLMNGVTVDLAARTVDPSGESPHYCQIDSGWPREIRRSNYDALVGSTCTKSGRSTGDTMGRIEAVTASFSVNTPMGTLVLRNQIAVTSANPGPFAQPGDSGAPAFSHGSGELFGMVNGGGPNMTQLNRVDEMENTFGVRIFRRVNGEGDPGENL